MWDVYVALNAQYHDNINLYEKWFPNATNNEIEDKIVEATISKMQVVIRFGNILGLFNGLL